MRECNRADIKEMTEEIEKNLANMDLEQYE
jgi:hypothetical protein